ncbi:DNA-J related domain-containing protein [Alteromonas genovensis]|uniref:DNA-J related domain-containing protein n=1 Tax=Alteromonas genovensis TaxID=471225 RepID=UPI002FE18288
MNANTVSRAQGDSPLHELLADMLVDILSTMVSMFEEGVSEYTLISMLKKPPYTVFDEEALRDPLMLFKTHFILFNALYQLRSIWLKDGVGKLDIYTLNIRLDLFAGADVDAGSAALKQELAPEPTLASEDESATTEHAHKVGSHDALASYYLDWNNFEQTDQESVEALLTSFWSTMGKAQYASFNDGDIEAAHRILGLTWPCAALPREEHNAYSLKEIKKHYRKKLQQLHPDKGGSREQAQQVISAYQLLVRFYSFK